MAENDQDQKTEQPTQKRLDEAREKGQLAVSRELSTLFMMVAILIVVLWLGPPMMRQLVLFIRVFIEVPHDLPLDGKGMQGVFIYAFRGVAASSYLVFCLLVVAAVLGTGLQTGFYVNATKLQPDPSRLSLLKGLGSLFSMNALVNLLKSFVKLVVLGGISLFMFKPLIAALPSYAGRGMEDSLLFLHGAIKHILIVLTCVVAVMAIADYVYQRYTYFKGLRMTKEEVKDEYKQMEGDPKIKGRLRQIRLEKARKRMMAKVPHADVVVTNPTHYAVALMYDNAKMAAPVVVAKGVDLVAQRIRAVAEDHEVPLVSNPPLARALFETVEIDQMVKPEQYKAVAEVISYVYKLKKRIWKKIER